MMHSYVILNKSKNFWINCKVGAGADSAVAANLQTEERHGYKNEEIPSIVMRRSVQSAFVRVWAGKGIITGNGIITGEYDASVGKCGRIDTGGKDSRRRE